MLHTILPARGKLQSVPARAAAKRNAVERTHHQLFAGKSTAYGLVARMISFPFRIRNWLLKCPEGTNCQGAIKGRLESKLVLNPEHLAAPAKFNIRKLKKQPRF